MRRWCCSAWLRRCNADKQKIGLKAAYKRLKQDEKVKKLMVKKFGRILIKDI